MNNGKAKAMIVFNSMRAKAAAKGYMSEEEIAAEIAAARQELTDMSEKKEREFNGLTAKAIEDAENGIGMSGPFNSVPELMEALNSDDVDEPNAETLAAIEEVQRMKADPSIGKSYANFDELLKELDV